MVSQHEGGKLRLEEWIRIHESFVQRGIDGALAVWRGWSKLVVLPSSPEIPVQWTCALILSPSRLTVFKQQPWARHCAFHLHKALQGIYKETGAQRCVATCSEVTPLVQRPQLIPIFVTVTGAPLPTV